MIQVIWMALLAARFTQDTGKKQLYFGPVFFFPFEKKMDVRLRRKSVTHGFLITAVTVTSNTTTTITVPLLSSNYHRHCHHCHCLSAVMSVTPEMVWSCQTEGQETEHVVATYLSDNFVPASEFSGRILHLQVGTAL